jgi:hypothetical protein
MKNNVAGIIIFILVFAFLGFFREFFFVNLNHILFHKYYNRPPDMPVASFMLFFERFDYATLYYLKYPFTAIGALFFFLANYFAVKTFSGSKFILKVLVLSYACMLLVAALSMLYGYLVNNRLADDEYTLSRWLLGIAQSPIICLILLASEKLYKSTKHEEGQRDL